MKNLLLPLALLAVTLVSCNNNELTTDPAPTPVVQENVAGDVSGVWAKGGTYKITNHIQIAKGASLTIQEGVNVVFSDSTVKPEFIVKGNLYILGTTASPVKLTVPDAWKVAKNDFGNLWGGIIADTTCLELVLDNAVLEYAGAVTNENSPSVKSRLYKAEPGQHVPGIYYRTINGKIVVINSRINNVNEDGMYLEGGKAIIANNVIYTQGVSGGDAVNIKSGVQADVAFNLIYSPNTNALKLSNTGGRSPQAHVVGYNNTIVNAGWRRPSVKGGSVWFEAGIYGEIYNNLLVNDRFGVKRDPKLKEDARSKVANNYYYGYTKAGVDQFQPSTEIIAGTNDIMSATVGANDPKFVNFPLDNPSLSHTYNPAWDFHLAAGSPALTKGTTAFTPLYASGLMVGGKMYNSPAPATYVGAYSTK